MGKGRVFRQPAAVKIEVPYLSRFKYGHVVIILIEGTAVKHYHFDGASMTYNSALSISGLTKLTAVAFRPRTWDRVIVDGNQLKYYAFDGSDMVEVPELSVTVNDLAGGGSYVNQGIALNH